MPLVVVSGLILWSRQPLLVPGGAALKRRLSHAWDHAANSRFDFAITLIAFDFFDPHEVGPAAVFSQTLFPGSPCRTCNPGSSCRAELAPHRLRLAAAQTGRAAIASGYRSPSAARDGTLRCRSGYAIP